MSRRNGFSWTVLVCGAAAFGMATSSALAGGFGISVGYSSGPSYAYGGYYSPVVVTRPAYYGGCATYVRHGDYYAYPTGTYVVPNCAPVVTTYCPPPAPVYYGRSFRVGGFYCDGPRYVNRVHSYGHRSYGVHRVCASPAPVRRAAYIGGHRGGTWGGRPTHSFVGSRHGRHHR